MHLLPWSHEGREGMRDKKAKVTNVSFANAEVLPQGTPETEENRGQK